MSHDSGFRRGGQDFSHSPKGDRRGTNKRSRKYEQRMSKRFHDQEREISQKQPEPESTPKTE